MTTTKKKRPTKAKAKGKAPAPKEKPFDPLWHWKKEAFHNLVEHPLRDELERAGFSYTRSHQIAEKIAVKVTKEIASKTGAAAERIEALLRDLAQSADVARRAIEAIGTNWQPYNKARKAGPLLDSEEATKRKAKANVRRRSAFLSRKAKPSRAKTKPAKAKPKPTKRKSPPLPVQTKEAKEATNGKTDLPFA